MKVSPYSYFRWCRYFWVPWVSFVLTDEFSVRVTKITSSVRVLWTHSLPFLFLPYLKSLKWWSYYKSDINQKFWITKLSESRLIYSRLLFEFCYWIKLYWYSCSIWDKLGWLNWLWQFPCEGLSSFNPKECCSCAWFCSLCKERISFCTGLISRKLFRFLFMFLTGSTSFSALLFFCSIEHLLCLYAWFLMLFQLTIDEVLSINPSTTVFVFGDFNVHQKD